MQKQTGYIRLLPAQASKVPAHVTLFYASRTNQILGRTAKIYSTFIGRKENFPHVTPRHTLHFQRVDSRTR
jgi:hypothetical protein